MESMNKKVVVIGAGIVGLHIAIALQEKNFEVYVLEQEAYPGHHTSTRNSGVIHAGVYYQEGSLKEKFCLEGNPLTYEWLKKLGVEHNPCGKWVIPGFGQDESHLREFHEKLKKLSIAGVRELDASQLAIEEPALKATSALYIPTTGVMDAAGYVRSLERYAVSKGIMILYHCKVLEVSENQVNTSRGPLDADIIINSAGLFADGVAGLFGLSGYEVKPCRGDYYQYNHLPISRPVYHPLSKVVLGLGIHLTPTFDHHLLLGPNAYFIDDKTDYEHRSKPDEFERTIRDHLPHLKHYQLHMAYTGNRPKLYYQGAAVYDFTIIKQDNRIQLLGIESPGLTASPAIARYVASMI
ncbi:MAG: 2-hydroxyglutarate dehydrogenase [uncultured bacterium]|nr:MAG: 2-hydroxyglutarate dehydrogenase [uncultured bacterium]